MWGGLLSHFLELLFTIFVTCSFENFVFCVFTLTSLDPQTWRTKISSVHSSVEWDAAKERKRKRSLLKLGGFTPVTHGRVRQPPLCVQRHVNCCSRFWRASVDCLLRHRRTGVKWESTCCQGVVGFFYSENTLCTQGFADSESLWWGEWRRGGVALFTLQQDGFIYSANSLQLHRWQWSKSFLWQ